MTNSQQAPFSLRGPWRISQLERAEKTLRACLQTRSRGETVPSLSVYSLSHRTRRSTFPPTIVPVLITGVTQGSLGAEVALQLSRHRPGILILAGRNLSKLQATEKAIKATSPGARTPPSRTRPQLSETSPHSGATSQRIRRAG